METVAKPSVVHTAGVAGEGTATVAQQSDKQVHPAADAKPKPVRARQDDKWKIFSGTANDALAKDVCSFLGLPLGQACISKFSDGETYVQSKRTYAGPTFSWCSPPAIQWTSTLCSCCC